MQEYEFELLNLKYLKISVEKGLLTKEEIIEITKFYKPFEDETILSNN